MVTLFTAAFSDIVEGRSFCPVHLVFCEKPYLGAVRAAQDPARASLRVVENVPVGQVRGPLLPEGLSGSMRAVAIVLDHVRGE